MNTVRESLPEDFQGKIPIGAWLCVDAIVQKERDLPDTIASLVRLHGGVLDEYCKNSQRSTSVSRSRLTTLDFTTGILMNYQLHSDRSFRDDGGCWWYRLAWKSTLTVVGNSKKRKVSNNLKRNFLDNHIQKDYRKALRLMKQAEKFGRPVATFINTAGAILVWERKERGQGEAIAHNLMEMSDLKFPIIAIIIGEGGSQGGALKTNSGC